MEPHKCFIFDVLKCLLLHNRTNETLFTFIDAHFLSRIACVRTETHQSSWHSESLLANVALIWIGRLHLLTSADIAGVGVDLRRGLLLRMRLDVTGVSALGGESHVALIALERLCRLLSLVRRRSLSALLLRLQLVIVRRQQLIRVVILLRWRRAVDLAV